MKRDFSIEKVFKHPPAVVWQAITDSQAIGEWLMKNDFEPRIGHKFQFRHTPRRGWNGITDCVVTELVVEKRLAYTWVGGTGEPDVPPTLDTVVSFTLEPHPEGTLLRLEHSGFSGLKGALVSFMMGAGWKKMMNGRFPTLLDRLGGGQPAGAPAQAS